MKICAFCKDEVEIDKYFSKKSTCPKCGADLHICLNCRFYSETSHNKCIDPKADYQRTRDRNNFCEYFSYRDNISSASSTAKEDAIKKLNDLFKK